MLFSGVRSELLGQLQQAVRSESGMSTTTFLSLVDRWQQGVYGKLRRSYRDDVYCQLLALKASNLMVRLYEHERRRQVLVSRPYHLFVDPANACQLACPGCVHTEGPGRKSFDWPRNTLKVDQYETFLSGLGAFASIGLLYNYGEPLLSPHFATFVRLAKSYLMYTMTSTNLSLPIDADAIVGSGLDWLLISVDGTTQEVYERYRRRGKLELVLNNVRELVAAKQRAGSTTPYLCWQFLTFEHNQHQAEEAIRMGRSLGVDCLSVVTPFEVTWDDPTIRAVRSASRGSHDFQPYRPRRVTPNEWSAGEMTARVVPEVSAAFRTSWVERFEQLGVVEEPEHGNGYTCPYLYDTITLDGAGRVMPCCMAPSEYARGLIFHRVAPGKPKSDLVNSQMAVLARTAFADRARFESQREGLGPDDVPFCEKCTVGPGAPYHLESVRRNLRSLDPEQIISEDYLDWFTARDPGAAAYWAYNDAAV